MTTDTPTLRSALLLGHPGHELRVYGWLRRARPRVDILTDGSGAGGASRLSSSAALLSSVGAERGTIFGRFSDREIYQAMMAGEVGAIAELTDQIAQQWIDAGIEAVASDAREGFNPTHDLCCEMARAAGELVYRKTGKRLRAYAFCLAEWEVDDHAPRPNLAGALRIRLDEKMLEDKIAAARSYCELGDEVDRALARKGRDYFRGEYLVPQQDWASQDSSYKPFYEAFGEKRVAEGKYAEVLRYGKHVLPILKALREHASFSPIGRGQRAGSA